MAVDPAELPADSLGPVQTDTSQMDASAALDTPAWGPMSAGASAQPAEADATPPMPPVPDFARIIPVSIIEAEKRQEQADEWAQQQRAQLADWWAGVAKHAIADQTQQAIDTQQAARASAAAGTIDLSGSQPPPLVNSGDTQDSQQSPGAQPAPAQAPLTMNNLADLLHTVISRVGQGATDVRTALGAGDANAASNPLPVAVQAAPGAVMTAATDPLATGVQAVNAVNAASGNGQPPAPTPQEAVVSGAAPRDVPAWGPSSPGASATAAGVLTPEQARVASLMGNVVAGGPEGLAAPVAAGADVVKAGIGVAKALPGIAANAVTDARTALDLLPGEAAMSGPGAARAAGAKVLPLDSMASTTWTADHPLVAQAADAAGVDTQRLVDTLNNDKTMTAIAKNPARYVDQPGREVQTAAYAVQQAQKQAQAAVVARDASSLAEDTKAVVQQAPALPADLGNAVIRGAGQEAAAAGDTQTADQMWDAIGSKPGEPAGAPPSGGTPAEPAAPTPGGPSRAAAFIRPGLSLGGAVGGEAFGLQQQDQQDPEILQIIKALPYAAAGALGGYALSGALPGGAGLAKTGGEALRGALISPSSAISKGTADVASLFASPAIRGTQALSAGRVASMPREVLAQTLGELKALPEAAGTFLDAFKNPDLQIHPDVWKQWDTDAAAIPKGDIGRHIATASIRPLAALTEATRVILERGAEEANGVLTGEGGLAAKPGMATAMGLQAPADFAKTRLFLGEPEGWTGKALLSVLQRANRIPGAGGLLAPFTRVPANLADRMVSATPIIGAANLAGRGVSPIEVAVRQGAGILLTAGLASAYGNNIVGANTGGLAGVRPWSVKVPNTDTWLSMNHLPPFIQGPMRAAATILDYQRGGNSQGAGWFFNEMGKIAQSAPLLPYLVQQGMGIGAAAVKGGKQLPEKLGDLASSQVPVPWFLRGSATAERATSPDVSGEAAVPAKATDAQRIGAAAQAKLSAQLPGRPEQSVPAYLEPSGQPERNPNQGPSGYISGVGMSGEVSDPVKQAFDKVGVPIPPVASTITTEKGMTVGLSGAQQRELEQSRGKYLVDAARGGLQDNEDAKQALTQATKDAEGDLLDRHPELFDQAVNKKDKAAAQAVARATQGARPAASAAPARSTNWGTPGNAPPAAASATTAAPQRTTNWGQPGKR